MLKRLRILLPILSLALGLTHCTLDNKRGDVGAPGPRGEDGSNGVDGKNGKDGLDGKNGLNGVAAVVYDTFDLTQSCSNVGQIIYVNTSRSFYVCQASTWSSLQIQGEKGKDGLNGVNGANGADGAPGKDGSATVVTDDVFLGGACAQSGQLVYNALQKTFYACRNSQWTELAIKGKDGTDGRLMVVVEGFALDNTCPAEGQLVYSVQSEQKGFFLCSGSKWMAIDLRGEKGNDGANGQTLFVENSSQLPACNVNRFGQIFILKASGDVQSCSNPNGTYTWVTLYQSPKLQPTPDLNLYDECLLSADPRFDAFRSIYLSVASITELESRKAFCTKLSARANQIESMKIAGQEVYYGSNAVFPCSFTRCDLTAKFTEDSIDTLSYLINIKSLTFSYADTFYFGQNTTTGFRLNDLSGFPLLPKLRSLELYMGNRTLKLGTLQNVKNLQTLILVDGIIAGSGGESGLKSISNMNDNLINLTLRNMRLTSRDLVEIARLKNLVTLDITGNAISDLSALASMDSIGHLYYTETGTSKEHCPFTDKGRCN